MSQAGMFPTYTLTEDYAFGMELKKKGFHARYVREYLAMGEAPHEVRNCFQQRSRWTKVSSSASACRQQASCATCINRDSSRKAYLGNEDCNEICSEDAICPDRLESRLTRAHCCMLCST